MTTRVALYARVSTSDQNPAFQVEELRAYAARRGWTVVAEHVDHGVSGTKDRRPELDAMLKKTRRGGVDVVLVWKFSRFARSVRQLVTALEEFKTRGVEFVSVSEGIDTGTPVGKMMFQVIGAIDEFFIDTMRENTKAGIAAARRRGRRLGRPKVRIDLDRAKELISLGFSVRGAARELGVDPMTLGRKLKNAE